MRGRFGKSLIALTITLSSILPGCKMHQSQFQKEFKEAFQGYKERLEEIDRREVTQKNNVAYYDNNKQEIFKMFGEKENLYKITCRKLDEEFSDDEKIRFAKFHQYLTSSFPCMSLPVN